MQEIFENILTLEGVKGVLLFSFAGDLVFQKFTSPMTRDPNDIHWSRFIKSLDGMRETDLLFEKGRLYIRRSDMGYVVIFMGLFVSMAMLRLNCDIILPDLTPEKTTGKWGRFFKRK